MPLGITDRPIDDLNYERALPILEGLAISPVVPVERAQMTVTDMTIAELSSVFGPRLGHGGSLGGGPICYRWSNGDVSAIDFGDIRVVYRTWLG